MKVQCVSGTDSSKSHTTKVLLIAQTIILIGIGTSAHAQLWHRPQAKQPPPSATPPAVIQEASPSKSTTPERPAEASKITPSIEPQIIKETRLYEQTLRELAEKAEQIVQRVPDKPDELARNFGELH